MIKYIFYKLKKREIYYDFSDMNGYIFWIQIGKIS